MKKISNHIRIIGGRYRGKKLSFPSAEGLRPTPDRIRETLFNWLMHDIRDARCLDAFAGSGALGFEAYSRGAAQVVLIEKNPVVARNLQLIAAGFDDCHDLQVISRPALDYLQSLSNQFDIIFWDPPFAHPELYEGISILEDSNVLIEGGILYIESAQEIALDPQIWQKLQLKQAGQVMYGLYRKRRT